MKGMSIDQFKEVVEFSQTFHPFGRIRTKEQKELIQGEFPNMGKYGMNIKYIESCYDSRTKTVWSVTFRGMGTEVNLRTTENFDYENLYDLCMDYLKGEYNEK